MLSTLIEHGHAVRRIAPARGPLGLHCMPTGAGFERRVNEAYSWDGLSRGPAPFLVIQHTLDGRGHLDFAGTRHRLEAGETMILSFPHANRYWLERGDSWEYFWIVLNGREALRLGRAVIDANGPVLNLPPATIDKLAEACLALLEAELPAAGAASGAAYGAMMALQDATFGEETRRSGDIPPAIARARDFIDAHLADTLDVERLARLAQSSRAHFVRKFSAALGRPPSSYVLERRMERASRLLIATDAAIAEISRSCGFADPNYFAKSFRRVFGTSPSQFRASGTGFLPRGGESFG